MRGVWLRFVQNIKENRLLPGSASDLSEFMFGSGRASLEVYRSVLADYQRGGCFYCLRPLRDRTDVDHFILWSCYPVDFGHNFVLAHGVDNLKKADRLAAIEHLERWCQRNEGYGDELTAAFAERNILHDLTASQRVTAWAYEQVQMADSLVWRRGDEMVVICAVVERTARPFACLKGVVIRQILALRILLNR